MTPEGHEYLAEDTGAYVLGALSDAEETRFVRHLRTCAVCQEEVAALTVARDALPRSVPMFDAPPTMKAAVMEAVRADLPPEPVATGTRVREKSARLFLGMRLKVASLSATAVLIAGLAVGFGVSQWVNRDAGGSRTVTAQFDSQRAAHGSGNLVISDSSDAGGTLRVHGMPSLPEGQTYQVWLSRRGEMIPKALFNVGEDGNGLTAVDGDLKDADAVLVTRERAGGARSPSGKPVLTVKL
jgi:anti-sigma-K factor RskA